MSLPPEPYELALLADFKRLLKAIRVGNGYHTDAGAHVFTADERLEMDPDGITLILDDAEEELLDQDGYRRHARLRVDVQIFVPVGQGADAREQARATTRKALVDVRRALLTGLRDESFAHRPVDVRLEGRSLLPLDPGGTVQTAVQPVSVQHLEEFQSA